MHIYNYCLSNRNSFDLTSQDSQRGEIWTDVAFFLSLLDGGSRVKAAKSRLPVTHWNIEYGEVEAAVYK